jgi:hypothetical protein
MIKMDKLPKRPARQGEPASSRRGNETIKNEISRLSALDLTGLRVAWRNTFAKTAPAHLPKHLLVRIIAYRIQANAYGDLDRKVALMLDRLVRQRAGTDGESMERIQTSRTLKPGTMLTRESAGELHRVTVLENGYAWNGGIYRSLSEVAHAITGTRWNGRRFFGLNKKGSSERRSRWGAADATSGEQS